MDLFPVVADRPQLPHIRMKLFENVVRAAALGMFSMVVLLHAGPVQAQAEDRSISILVRPLGQGRGAQVTISDGFGSRTREIGRSPREPFRYPTLTSLGRSTLIYVPDVAGEAGASDRALVTAPPGWRVLPRAADASGFAVIAPPSAVDRRPGFDLVWEGQVAPGWRRDAELMLADALTDLGLPLGEPPSGSVVVAVSPVEADARPGGEVTGNGVMHLRLPERAYDPSTDRADLAALIAHEAVHLWFARLPNDAGLDLVVSEGAADYYGWTFANRYDPGRNYLKDKIDAALETCGVATSIDTLEALGRGNQPQAVYACGAVLQFLLHAGTGMTAHPLETPWRTLAADLRQGGATGPGWFMVSLAGRETERRILDDFMAVARPGGWMSIVGLAGSVGQAFVASAPDDMTVLDFAFRPLLESACGDYWGIARQTGGDIRLFGPPGCSAAPESSLLSVNGAPLQPATLVLERVEDVCRRRGSIRLEFQTAPAASIDCRKDVHLPPPETRWEPARALPATVAPPPGWPAG